MTYTPDEITAYIAQRVAVVGEEKGVRIIKQLVAQVETCLTIAAEWEETFEKRDQQERSVGAGLVFRDIRAALPTQEKARDA